MTRGDPAADREQAHPLIRRHPESGVDALFVNPPPAWPTATKRPAPIFSPAFTITPPSRVCCRWRWRAGDVAIWDNRTTLHYAVNDYDGYRRLLYRTTGDPPNTG